MTKDQKTGIITFIGMVIFLILCGWYIGPHDTNTQNYKQIKGGLLVEVDDDITAHIIYRCWGCPDRNYWNCDGEGNHTRILKRWTIDTVKIDTIIKLMGIELRPCSTISYLITKYRIDTIPKQPVYLDSVYMERLMEFLDFKATANRIWHRKE